MSSPPMPVELAMALMFVTTSFCERLTQNSALHDATLAR